MIIRPCRTYAAMCLATALMTIGLLSTATAQSTYTIRDLGTLPGNPYTTPSGINSNGQVTGFSSNDGTIGNHAFLYSGGTMHDLGVLDPDYILAYSQGTGINDYGQVTGFSSSPDLIDPPPDSYQHGFLYSGGTMHDLGTLGGHFSEGRGINNVGQVTGSASLSGETATHAFRYSNGTMKDLGTLAGYDSHGSAINGSGQVTGYLSKTCVQHAFLYSGGKMTDMGTLGGYLSSGNAINAWGQIVGSSQMIPSCATLGAVHAFLYRGGAMMDIGTLGGDSSVAYGINGSGQIVGASQYAPSDYQWHAFLYVPGRAMVDLNTLLPSGSGWTLQSASAINDAGQITGTGIAPDGSPSGFLLTPPRQRARANFPMHIY